MIAETILAVGILQNDTALQIYVEQTLHKAGIKTVLQLFKTQETAFQAVAEGKIATFACTLDTAPTTLPIGLVITALLERLEMRNSFVTKNANGLIFDESKKVKALVLSDINRAQMQYLQPDFEVIKTDLSLEESINAVRLGEFAAVVLSQTDLNISDLKADNWQIQPFSVREFVPKAGQNVACFVTAEDDLPIRRLLQTLHHSSVSAVTNVERTIQKLLKDKDLCAYCERDRMGNYHLWAAALINNEFKKIRLSQSTTFGMAEKAVEQLLSA